MLNGDGGKLPAVERKRRKARFQWIIPSFLVKIGWGDHCMRLDTPLPRNLGISGYDSLKAMASLPTPSKNQHKKHPAPQLPGFSCQNLSLKEKMIQLIVNDSKRIVVGRVPMTKLRPRDVAEVRKPTKNT